MARAEIPGGWGPGLGKRARARGERERQVVAGALQTEGQRPCQRGEWRILEACSFFQMGVRVPESSHAVMQIVIVVSAESSFRGDVGASPRRGGRSCRLQKRKKLAGADIMKRQGPR